MTVVQRRNWLSITNRTQSSGEKELILGFGRQLIARCRLRGVAGFSVQTARATRWIAVHFTGRAATVAGAGYHAIVFVGLVVVLVDVVGAVAVNDVVAIRCAVRGHLAVVRVMFALRSLMVFAVAGFAGALLAAVRVLRVRFQRVIRAFGRALIQLLLGILLGAFVRVWTVAFRLPICRIRKQWLLRRCQRIVAAAHSRVAAFPIDAIVRVVLLVLNGVAVIRWIVRMAAFRRLLIMRITWCTVAIWWRMAGETVHVIRWSVAWVLNGIVVEILDVLMLRRSPRRVADWSRAAAIVLSH